MQEEKKIAGQKRDEDILKIMKERNQKSDPNKQYTQKELKRFYLKLREQLRKEENASSKGIFKGSSSQNSKCQDGISWGLVDDDEVYRLAKEDEDNKLLILDYHALRLLPNLTEKQLQKIDQSEQKKQKVEHLENELEVLQQQEARSHGLEESKKRRKEAIETKLQEAVIDFEMAEENLKFNLFAEKKDKKKITKIQDEDTYGDDEFFDRTKKMVHQSDQQIVSRILKKQQQAIAPLEVTPYDFADVENFESLQKKLKYFVEERNQLNLQFLEICENETNEERKQIDEDDDLGAFLKENEKKLLGEKKTKHLERLKFLQSQIEKTKALMQLSNPGAKIQEPQVMTNQLKKEKDINISVPFFSKIPKPKAKEEKSNISKTLQQLKQKSKAYHNEQNPDDLSQYIPALKRLEEEEKRMEMQHRDRMLLDSRILKDQQKEEEEMKAKSYGVKKKPKERNLTEYEAGESNQQVWRPPENQTGDGKTSLNEKLGY